MRKGTPCVPVSNVTITHTTEKGARVEVGGRAEWIPLWSIAENSPIRNAGQTGTLRIAREIAQQKGWA